MTTNKDRSERTRRLIVEEATRLFSEVGVADGSMRTLAEALGLSKAGLYHHFASKDELAFEVHREVIDDVNTSLARILQSGASAERQLRSVIHLMIKSVAENRNAFTVLLRDGYRLPESYWIDLRTRREQFRQGVEDVVAGGMKAGEFRETDARLVTFMILGFCNWAYTWIRPDGRWPVDQIAQLYGDLLIDGLRSGSADSPPDESDG